MLTDEEIDAIGSERAPYTDFQFARAIESAACSERDALIAELEQQLAEARKDAERYRFLCNCRGQHTELCFDGESYRGKQEFDAAIDTAIKEQT